MILAKKLFTIFLILLAFNLSMPKYFYGQEAQYLSMQNEKDEIRETQIEMRSTTEEEILEEDKKSNSWLWALLAIVLAGGVAALALNSGDSGESNDGSTTGGSGTVSW